MFPESKRALSLNKKIPSYSTVPKDMNNIYFQVKYITSRRKRK